MAGQGFTAPVEGWSIWGRPLGWLLLILLGPLALFLTPFTVLAMTWVILVLLGLWILLASALIGAMVGSSTSGLSWLECRVKAWVARFAPDPEALWLHWARHSSRPATAHWCLERALQLGGAEAMFQEGLTFLEGGFGPGGPVTAVDRFRKAAARGQAEAAFRLAEILRNGQGAVVPEPGEAELWYRRAASKGFGPAAAWLARAYREGDGLQADAVQARRWADLAEGLQPHQPLSRSLFRHDAAPEDPLAKLGSRAVRGLERGADRLVARRGGRWILGLTALILGALALVTVGSFFWAGSSSLYHLPLLMLAPSLLLLGWQAWRLRREGPCRGRDRLRDRAERGDGEACFQLGLRYQTGDPHLPKDNLEAALWFRKAAEAGHQGAMEALAQAYLGGHGVLRNAQEAARWAEAAGQNQLPLSPDR